MWFLTNRMNLNGILSSRIIGPRKSFTKYYRDLLELSPGHVPLLSAPPSPELVEFASSATRTGPVLLELGRRASEPSAVGMLTGAIPFTEVVAIHLPDERSLREHTARRYANVHPHEHLLRVTPEVFTGPGIGLDGLESLTITSEADVTDWVVVDRVRGAMSAAVRAVESASALRTAAACLPDGPRDGWLNADLLQGRDEDHSAELEPKFFRSAQQVLAATDTASSWDPVGIVSQVESRCRDHDLPDAELQTVFRNLAGVRAVVSNERPFTPFGIRALDL